MAMELKCIDLEVEMVECASTIKLKCVDVEVKVAECTDDQVEVHR